MARRQPDPADVHIGAALRRRRLELGQSQSDLGGLIGVSFQQVQKYERGSNRIAVSTLLRVAAAQSVQLSYYIDELEGETEERSPAVQEIQTWLGSKQAWSFAAAVTQLSGRARSSLLQFVRNIKPGA